MSIEFPTTSSRITGVILAGGRSRRMGGDKPQQILEGKSLLEYVVALAAPQVDELILSSNSSAAFFRQFGFPIVKDRDSSQAGPLLGIASAMAWTAENHPKPAALPLVACFPVDVPIFPETLVEELKHALLGQNKQVAFARQAGQIQPLFSLWALSAAPFVDRALHAGISGPKQLLWSLDATVVEIQYRSELDFTNLNTKQDMLALAEKL